MTDKDLYNLFEASETFNSNASDPNVHSFNVPYERKITTERDDEEEENPQQQVPSGKKRAQRYRTAWELMSEFKDWLKPVPNNPYKAACSVCNKIVVSEIMVLRKHAIANRHIQNVTRIKQGKHRRNRAADAESSSDSDGGQYNDDNYRDGGDNGDDTDDGAKVKTGVVGKKANGLNRGCGNNSSSSSARNTNNSNCNNSKRNRPFDDENVITNAKRRRTNSKRNYNDENDDDDDDDEDIDRINDGNDDDDDFNNDIDGDENDDDDDDDDDVDGDDDDIDEEDNGDGGGDDDDDDDNGDIDDDGDGNEVDFDGDDDDGDEFNSYYDDERANSRIGSRRSKSSYLPTPLKVAQPAPFWKGKAIVGNEIVTLKLTDFKGRYLVLFFYSENFSTLCSNEVASISDGIELFKQFNADVVACSVDSEYAHLAWSRMERKNGGVATVQIPLLSDATHNISKMYGCYDSEEGVAQRAVFIIDPDGILRHIRINDTGVGRNAEDILRILSDYQYNSDGRTD